MRYDRYPESIFRPLGWATGAFLLGGLITGQILPLGEWQRAAFDALIVFAGIFTFSMLNWVLPRAWNWRWIFYAITLFHMCTIALADYLIGSFDLSPLYALVIIVVAVVADIYVALFAAILANILHAWMVMVRSGGFNLDESGFLRIAIYYLAALLVSQLAQALNERWRIVAAQAEQQRREAEQRKEELEGLHQVSHAFENLEDTRATFKLVTQQIAQLLRVEICAMASFDKARGQLVGTPPGYGLSDEQIQNLAFDIDTKPDSLWELTSREYYFLNDLSVLPLRLQQVVNGLGVRQMAVARMHRRRHTDGILVIANKIDGAFEEKDARFLNLLAQQAASAVENTQLYRETQTTLEEVARLYALSTELAAQFDPDEIPARVVNALVKALRAPTAAIALMNESKETLEYAATNGIPAEILQIPIRPNGLGMMVVHSGEARFIEDTQQADNTSEVSAHLGHRAVACLPIQHGGKALGALYVNYAEPHVFGEIERNILRTFANQTAIALENARLIRAERRKAQEMGALVNLSRSLAETMDYAEILHGIEHQIRISLPAADIGMVFTYDHASQALIPQVAFGIDLAILQMAVLYPGEDIAGRVFQTKQAAIFNGIESFKQAHQSISPENSVLFAAALPADRVIQSAIGVPMRTSSEILGVIVLASFKSPHAFTMDDMRFLETLADRAALGIRNAQLYDDTTRRTAQLEMINDLGHNLSSILDMDELVPTLVRLVRFKLGYHHINLFINDPAQKQTQLRASSELKESVSNQLPTALRYDQGLVGWVAGHGETVMANDVSQDTRFLFTPLIPETRAEIAVPLAVGSRCIGVLDVQSNIVNAFDKSDVVTLETLASQVAIALENARLYGEVQEQAQHDSLTQAFNHGFFLRRLTEEIDRAQQTRRPLTLIMLDIDLFKEYNDRYGHVAGDKILELIVQAIRIHIKHTDLVGRWGGEEFSIVLLDTDESDAIRVSERIRKTMRETKLSVGDTQAIPAPTISQGIAVFPADASDMAALVDSADTALYRAKARGRDQVCLSSQVRKKKTWR